MPAPIAATTASRGCILVTARIRTDPTGRPAAATASSTRARNAPTDAAMSINRGPSPGRGMPPAPNRDREQNQADDDLRDCDQLAAREAEVHDVGFAPDLRDRTRDPV